MAVVRGNSPQVSTKGCSRDSPALHDAIFSPCILQGVDEIFQLFKEHLEDRLKRKGKELEGRQKNR